MGWRLSRLVAVLDFSLFGAIVGASLTAGTDAQWFSAAIGAVAFGILALWMNNYSELIACGLIAGFVAAVLSGIVAAPLAAVLLVVGVAFTCSMALTCIAHRQASAVMTAVQGGLLSAFGLAACLACNGGWWHEIRRRVRPIQLRAGVVPAGADHGGHHVPAWPRSSMKRSIGH